MKKEEVIALINKELREGNINNVKRRKLEAIKCNLEGLKTKQISEEIKITQRSVERYLKEYKENGIHTLISEKKTGYRRKISKETLEGVKMNLKKSPTEFRFIESEWNSKVLNKYLKSEYQVKVSLETCRKILLSERDTIEYKESSKLVQNNINELAADKNNNVWYVDELYIGIREYKIRDKARVYVLVAINVMKKRIRVKYFSTLNSERTDEIKKFVFSITKKIYKRQTYILVDKNPQNKNAFLGVRLKQRSNINGKLKIVYVNASSKISPLLELKKKILKDLALVDKEGNRKAVTLQKERLVKKYLENMTFENMKLDINDI